MLNESETKKRLTLQDVLMQLSTSQETLEDKNAYSKYYSILEWIYLGNSSENEFRHFYSDIFGVLVQIKQSGNDLHILSQNLNLLRENYKPHEEDADGNVMDITAQLRKLCDHVNLEVARLSYSDMALGNATGKDLADEVNKEISILRAKIDVTESENNKLSIALEEAKNELSISLEDAKNELNRSKLDIVAVIGLFSGVIIAFFSGFNYIASAISAVGESELSAVMFVVALAGFVLYNIIYFMMNMIMKILGKHSDKNIENSVEWFNVLMIAMIIVLYAIDCLLK